MLLKVFLGNENILVTPASKTEKILEEPTYEQIAMLRRTFASGGAACQA